MPPSVILNDRYRLEGRLGIGGMAVVYRGRDLMLERTVAIKILRQDFSGYPLFRDRFHQEAKAVANLSHPNIVIVHDYGIANGFPFIVMEYVPGSDLRQILQKRGRFTVKDTLNLMIQACAGLGFAHRVGLVHCDIKPQNILVVPDKHLKITDFGIARALSSIRQEEQAQYVWGSPQYLSPEQASGFAPSPASDVYALGVVIYEMLTGQLPFAVNSPAELIQAINSRFPIPPQELNSEIPDVLNQVISKILSKEPAARYRTADQLGYILLPISRQWSERASSSINSTGMSEAPSTPHLPSVGNGSIQKEIVEDYEADILNDHNYEKFLSVDWVTLLLGLLALLAVGGLLPFGIWVFYH